MRVSKVKGSRNRYKAKRITIDLLHFIVLYESQFSFVLCFTDIVNIFLKIRREKVEFSGYIFVLFCS